MGVLKRFKAGLFGGLKRFKAGLYGEFEKGLRLDSWGV
jgi:hypothetical protein